MRQSSRRVTGFPRLISFGLLGGFLGFAVAGCWNPLSLGPRDQLVAAPYRIPKIPGGTPLRLAMVHDVLHERYLRHGPAWYGQRNVEARGVIAKGAGVAPPSQSILDAMDDLAIGLANIGQYDEAIATMRNKLLLVPPLPAPASRPSAEYTDQHAEPRMTDTWDLQSILAAQNLSPMQHQQYSSAANLGTILVHSAMPQALAGDVQAKARVREGLAFIEQSIAINPGAHFGRETWQAIAIEHLLAAVDHPDLLLEYDLFGDPLDHQELQELGDPLDRYQARRPAYPIDSELTPRQRLEIRSRIFRAGVDKDWAEIVHPDYAEPMPFDEPVLAIIGMWTLGGGPSPHFALALGRIMENLGQREIAWNAYERAVELKDRFWPDPAVREKMVALCRSRQLGLAHQESSDSEAWQSKMRLRHSRELAWGLDYQKAYQDFEATQIAAGVPLDDPGFYAGFSQNRPSVASSPGLADDFILPNTHAYTVPDSLPCLILGAGLAMAIALILPEGRRW